MKKEISKQEYANGQCVCFDCEDVHDCEWRSRYATKCASYNRHKKTKK